MSTNRDVIESLRSKLGERNADSTYSNQFLYQSLLEQAKWLIKREISKGSIWGNAFFFQSLRCIDVVETSTIDPCCPIKTNCKIYRTKHKIPDIWIDDRGPMIRAVTSIDNTTEFFYTTASTWAEKRHNPYQRMIDQKNSFFADGYIWFPEHNPHKVNVVAFWVEDITGMDDCHPGKPCVRFMDKRFMLPPWLEAECFAKALQQIAGITERMPQDVNIDKNPQIKS